MKPTRTQYGKLVIYRADDGERLERWSVDARAMLATGEFVAAPPEGEPPVAGPAPEPEPEPKVLGIEAERASRLLAQWTKNVTPAQYLERYGEDTDNGKLARQIVDAQEAAKKAEPVKTGEVGPARPVTLPDPR